MEAAREKGNIIGTFTDIKGNSQQRCADVQNRKKVNDLEPVPEGVFNSFKRKTEYCDKALGPFKKTVQ